MVNIVSPNRAQFIPESRKSFARSITPKVSSPRDGSIFSGGESSDSVSDEFDALSHLFVRTSRPRATRGGLTSDETGDSSTFDSLFSECDDDVAAIAALISSPGYTPADLSMVRRLLPETSALALMLSGMLDDPALDETIRKDIERQLDTLIAHDGEHVLASRQKISTLVGRYACSGVSPAGLRRTYATLLLGRSRSSTAYRCVIRAFGFSWRYQVLEFLECAAAADLGACVPGKSMQSAKPLFELLLELRLLRCSDQAMMTYTARCNSDLDASVIEFLLSATDGPESAQRALSNCIRRRLAFEKGHGIAAWLTQLVAALGRCPIGIFTDMGDRTRMLEFLDSRVRRLIFLHGAHPASGWSLYA